MSGYFQDKLNKYQIKYPLYTHNALVDLMVKDGVISPEIAKKIKANESLFFIIDNPQRQYSEKDTSFTKILGAEFSNTEESKKKVGKTHFNRKIENTFQSEIQGDCWLLSDINAMKQTEWGKEAIKNAIFPDKYGGVTIKFKGSPLLQKKFYISKEDIQNAKNSKKYSTGDDDMLALELATEQVIKQLVKTGKFERISDFDEIVGYKSYLTGIYLDRKSNKTLSISTLITGIDRVHADFTACDSNSTPLLKKEKTLSYLAKKQNTNTIVCTFSGIKDMLGAREQNDVVHGFHAYAIKSMIYGKKVILSDPYHTDKEICLPWNKFIEDVESLYISSPDEQSKNQIINNALCENYIEKYQEHLNTLAKARKKTLNELEKLKNEKNLIEIKYKLDKCLNSSSWTLLDQENSFAYEGILSTMNSIDSDIVLQVLEQKPDLITKLDKYQSGWGNGSKKKALIQPIIDALIKKAIEVNINSENINKFKTKCYKELDAMFYTNEKIIIEEIDKLKTLIKNYKSNSIN